MRKSKEEIVLEMICALAFIARKPRDYKAVISKGFGESANRLVKSGYVDYGNRNTNSYSITPKGRKSLDFAIGVLDGKFK